jgi:hypothetical protein
MKQQEVDLITSVLLGCASLQPRGEDQPDPRGHLQLSFFSALLPTSSAHSALHLPFQLKLSLFWIARSPP